MGEGVSVPVGVGIGVSVSFGNWVAVGSGFGVAVRVAIVAVGMGCTEHAARKKESIRMKTILLLAIGVFISQFLLVEVQPAVGLITRALQYSIQWRIIGDGRFDVRVTAISGFTAHSTCKIEHRLLIACERVDD